MMGVAGLGLSLALAASAGWAVAWRFRLGGLGAFLVATLELMAAVAIAGLPLHHLTAGAILAAQAVLTAAALVAARPWLAARRPAPSPPGLLQRWRQTPWWLQLLLLVAAAETVWTVARACVFPPYAWDGLTYHLPAAALWVQQGYIGQIEWSQIWANVYPQNGELLMAWCFAFVRGQTLVQLVQLPFALAGAAATAALAGDVGLDRNAAAAASLAFYLAPIVLAQSGVAYVDLIFATLFLIGVHFALQQRPVWAGVALGLTAGVKTAGLGYAALAALIATATAGRGQRWRTLLALALPAGLLGCGWYLRTWALYGNPIYPIAVPHLFPGEGSLAELVVAGNVPAAYQGHPLYALFSTWFEHGNLWNYDVRQAGFGPLWPIACLPALPYLLARRGAPAWRLAAYLGGAFLIQPMHWWTRFSIALFPLGAVALAAVLTSDDAWLRRAALAATLLLVLAGAALGSVRQPGLGPRRFLQVTADEVAHRLTRLGVYYGDEYRWLESVDPGGVRIAAIKVWFPYVLLGERLQNRVSFQVDAATQYIMAPADWTPPAGWSLYAESNGYRVYEREKGADGRHAATG